MLNILYIFLKYDCVSSSQLHYRRPSFNTAAVLWCCAAAADILLSRRAAEVIAPFGTHYPTMLNGFVRHYSS